MSADQSERLAIFAGSMLGLAIYVVVAVYCSESTFWKCAAIDLAREVCFIRMYLARIAVR